jgi:FMN reductase
MNILSISGSPSQRARSSWLLQLAQARLESASHERHSLYVRELPAHALVSADLSQPEVAASIARVAEAQVLIVATPIYKAAYSGLLKVWLDLLPQDALRGKTVLPLATGGSMAHLLAVDYALKPVLSALGARNILDGVYATDAQMPALPAGGGYAPDDALLERLDRALQPLLAATERMHSAVPVRC